MREGDDGRRRVRRHTAAGLGALAVLVLGLVAIGWVVVADAGETTADGLPDADADEVPITGAALIGRWAAVDADVVGASTVPWLEFAEDGTFVGGDGCRPVTGTWSTDALVFEHVGRGAGDCDGADLSAEPRLYDDGTLRFEGSLSFRGLQELDVPTHDQVVGDWLTSDGHNAITFGRKVDIGGCQLDWSIDGGALTVVRWNMCDSFDPPYTAVVEALEDGAPVRVSGTDFYASGATQTLHLVRPAAIDFPEEVIGHWVGTAPDGESDASVTYEADGRYSFGACNSGGGRWWVEDGEVVTYGFMTAAGCSGYRGILDFIASGGPLPTGDEWTLTTELDEDDLRFVNEFNEGDPVEPGPFSITLHRSD